MIKAFESEHPDIQVKSEAISFTDIEQQIVREVQSGNAPDVAEMQGNYTIDLAQLGALEGLDSYASKGYGSSIIPTELDLGKVDNQLIAVPWTVAPFAFWFNKKVLQKAGLDPNKPPKTIEELLKACAAIKKSQPKVIPFGLDTTNRPFGLDANWSWMKAFGAQPFDGTKATADTPEMQKYLDFMRTLAKQKYTPVNQKAGDFRQPAASDQVAFLWDGPYPKGVIQSTNHASDKQFFATWGATTAPTTTGTPVSVPTDHQLVMFKSSKNKQAAWEFMQFLSSSENAMAKYTIGYEGSLPPVQSPPASIAGKLDDPISTAFNEQVIPTVTRPAWGSAYSSGYSDVMANVQDAMTSSKPIAEVASAMQSQLGSDIGGG
jgi:multiple sugar transport system substrate-binding protein